MMIKLNKIICLISEQRRNWIVYWRMLDKVSIELKL